MRGSTLGFLQERVPLSSRPPLNFYPDFRLYNEYRLWCEFASAVGRPFSTAADNLSVAWLGDWSEMPSLTVAISTENSLCCASDRTSCTGSAIGTSRRGLWVGLCGGLLAMPAVPAKAGTNAFLTIEGVKQGKFKGGSPRPQGT
jgi:hypothetical protein